MTILQIIKNKLEGKTILINNEPMKVVELKVNYDGNNSEDLEMCCEGKRNSYWFRLEEEFEIITKE
jgi:hypothetical protein